MDKSTYMYWQKMFDRVDHNKELEERILAIREEYKDFGYRRALALLRKEGVIINKKKVQRIMQNLDYRSHHILARVGIIALTRVRLVVKVGWSSKNFSLILF